MVPFVVLRELSFPSSNLETNICRLLTDGERTRLLRLRRQRHVPGHAGQLPPV